MEIKKAEEEAAEKKKQGIIKQEMEAKQRQLEDTLEQQEREKEKEREVYKNTRKLAAERAISQELT